ncbi:MAG: hypothetical protein KC731_16975 [Myxococcales bacterium]|nr:hypothetical protein [Myxococcales bacterium]
MLGGVEGVRRSLVGSEADAAARHVAKQLWRSTWLPPGSMDRSMVEVDELIAILVASASTAKANSSHRGESRRGSPT